MKKSHDLLWPDYVKTWCHWDERAFQAHAEGQEWIGYAGPGGTGKSLRAAKQGCIFWLSAPTTCRVAVTSTTIDSANARSWGYVKELLNAGAARWNWIDIRSKAKPNHFHWAGSPSLINCIILAPVLKGGKDKEERTLSTLIGVHPKDGYMILVDECNFMPSGIFGVFANAKKGTTWFQAQAIANPIDKFDPHGIMCTPKYGWDSIDPLKQTEWQTDKGVCLYLSPYKSPAIIHPDPEVKKFFETINFPTMLSLENDKAQYGENTVEYHSQCLGLWPPAGMDKVVVSPQILESGRAFDKPDWQPVKKHLIAGLDPAFVAGGDSCILQFAELGFTSDGYSTLAFTERVSITRDALSVEDVFDQVARKTKEECEKRFLSPKNLGVECHGTGMGFAAILAKDWSNEFIRIDGSSSPSDDIIDTKTGITAKHAYKNKITEIWFAVKRYVSSKQIKNMPKDAAQQFSLRRYKGPPEQQKLQIEPKLEFKQRLGRVAGQANKSPDEADAASICIEVARLRFLFRVENAAIALERRTTWNNDPYNYEKISKINDMWQQRETTTNFAPSAPAPKHVHAPRGTYGGNRSFSGYKKM